VLLSGDVAWERLLEAAGVVYRDVPHVNRCLWWIGGRLPRDVQPRPATITRARLDLLREADAIVMEGLRRHHLDREWE